MAHCAGCSGLGMEGKPSTNGIKNTSFSAATYYGAGGLAPSGVALRDRAQTKCLRQIWWLNATATTDAVRQEGTFPDFDVLTCREATKAMEKLMRFHERILDALLLRRWYVTGQSAPAGGSWRKMVQEVTNCLALTGQICEEFTPTIPPLVGCKIQVNWPAATFFRNIRRTDSPQHRFVNVIEFICSLGQFDQTVFTDGSAKRGAHRG